MQKGVAVGISFTLHNPGATPASALLNTHLFSSAINVYGLQATGPCHLPSGFPFPQPVLITLRAGEQLKCTYQLQRGPAAHSDTVLIFGLVQSGPPPVAVAASKSYLVGDLTRLHTQQVITVAPSADQAGRVHLTLRNDGPTAVAGLVYSACSPGIGPDQFIEVLSGPCQQIGPGLCGGGTLETGFSLPALPVGSTAHCEFRLSGASLTLFPLTLHMRKSGGATLVNTHPSSNELTLGGIPTVSSVALPLTGIGMWCLLFLAASGIAVMRPELHAQNRT